MNKQTAILAGFILLLYCNLTAFYLGCQSGLNPGINANWAYADSIFTRITNAHYNNTMTSIHTDNALGTLKTKLINHGLKSVLIDYRTGSDIEPSHWKSPSALALSNSMMFEAEFVDATQVAFEDHNDDRYWYCSNGDEGDRVGNIAQNVGKSHGYTWVADPDSLEAENGYVFSNLKWRWRPDKRVGDQFQFTGMHLLYGLNDTDDSVLQDFYAGKYLNITFAFTMGKLATIADTDTLLSFELIGYSEDGADPLLFSHINQSSGTSGQITHLIKEQYAGLETEFTYGNKLLTIKVSLLDLYLGGYLRHRDGNYYKTIMGFISPRLFWHGNGSLELDYILMEDSVFDELQNITSSTNGGSNYITSATDVLSNHGDIFTNVYAFNEPRHPQMKSYADIENQLSANISSFPGLVTSVHDHYRDYFKSNGKRFDNPLLFLKQVKPKIFMPNPYYLEADYHFNDDGLESVQEVFNGLASKYKEYKLELIQGNYDADQKYQICVQTMGHWWGTTDIPFESNPKGFVGWSWLRPPKETQKAMKFLPLCYGVDGIHDFMFQSFRQGNES